MAVLGLCSGCPSELATLDRVCPGDPMVPECRSVGCAGPYECISYCVQNYPDSEGIPTGGRGSWCDDPRVPVDFGDFCSDHDDVLGCTDWCAGHEGRCHAATDGDGDLDSDHDTDGDSDVDSDTDTDTDPDEDPDLSCGTDDDCPRATEAHCDGSRCVPCTSGDHCSHLGGLPVCDEGGCYPCSATDPGICAAARPYCDATAHECVACLEHGHCSTQTPYCDPTAHTCTECLEQSHCTEPDASQCNESHECVGCGSDEHCTDLAGRPACESGVCYECSTTNASACTGETPRCDTAGHSCVQCLAHADCHEAAAGQCDETHHCVPCTDDEHCAGVADLPHCAAGTCVACAGYAHCPTGQVCNYTTHACVEACRECHTEPDDCADVLGAGFYCDRDWADPARWHCFQRAVAEFPACERPWVRFPTGICMPPTTTTCQGLLEFGQVCDPRESALTCGDDDIAGDGACPDPEGYCTYRCIDTEFHDEWCPTGASCTAVGCVR